MDVFTRKDAAVESINGRRSGFRRSLLKVGLAGASHAEWVFEAIQELIGGGDAERIGVWLEDPVGLRATETDPMIFRGEVWEEGIASGVLEWTRLRVDAPLRLATLRAGLSCEYEIEGAEAGALLGPELQLRRVLWVPVMVRRILRGLVMEGTLHKKRALSSASAEKVAEELELLLEFEEEHRLAAARKADLDFWLRIKRLLSEEQSTNMILGQLAESCTRSDSMGGVGAAFALIGERKYGPSFAAPIGTNRDDHLLVRAESGDAAWAHAVNGGPLESLWRRAMENDRVAGAEADQLPLAKDISRIVAIPVALGNAMAGVLLAGLPKQRATLETLDRLEWRGALATDVFEQEQRFEAQLQEQLWRKTLLETSEQPAILITRQGLIAGMSRGAQKLVQTENVPSFGDKESTRFTDLFLPCHANEVQRWTNDTPEKDLGTKDRLELRLAGGTQVKLRRLATSGPEFSAVVLDRVLKQEHGRPVKEALEALQQAIEWLEEGVVVFDQDGEILARNGMFLRLLGLNEAEGRKLLTLEELIQKAVKNAAQPTLFATEWRALAANCTEATHGELRMDRPVAQVIDRYARPIIGTTGEKLGRVEVYRAMLARRALSSKVTQTQQLASLGQRVTRIVHELNSPLTTILGNAQRLLQREEGNRHSAEASLIFQEAERASGIVRQLLNLPPEDHPDMQLISLNELVESTLELQRASLAGSHVRLKTETEERLPRVRGDQGQLQQVLLNLLQNAQQAMQDSGRGSLLRVRTASAGPGRVRLEVSDDGPGIPEALHGRIFDPFFTTKPPGKGSGLGLAIVSGFVRQHGGTIAVFSSQNEGTRFVVELPAAEEAWQSVQPHEFKQDRQTASFPAALSEGGTVSASGSVSPPPRILVVEDEPTVAALIGDVLREEGMEVDVLPDGAKALELVQHSSYDLVICDVRMPGMDGQIFFEALAQARSPLRDHVLFVTGDGVAARTRDFLVRHHLPYVAKPFRVEELCLAVRGLLSSKPAATGPWSEPLVNNNLGIGTINEENRDSAE